VAPEQFIDGGLEGSTGKYCSPTPTPVELGSAMKVLSAVTTLPHLLLSSIEVERSSIT
jgi:hypothetical protein